MRSIELLRCTVLITFFLFIKLEISLEAVRNENIFLVPSFVLVASGASDRSRLGSIFIHFK